MRARSLVGLWVAVMACMPESTIQVGGTDAGTRDGGQGTTGGGSAAGGGTAGTGGGAASAGGGAATTGGGSATTGGGSAVTGGGSAATGGGIAADGGGSAAGGGSASTGGGTSSTGGGSVMTGGGSATTGGGSAGSGGGTTSTGGGTGFFTVQASVTADNAYSFGYGNSSGITNFVQGSRANSAGDIFSCGIGPEAYTVPNISVNDYLYIISWDDLSVTQGVIGQFSSGALVNYTGDQGWEVCATGIDMSTSQIGPNQTDVNQQIIKCNQGTGDHLTTSGGWVDANGPVTSGAVGTLAVGETNHTVYTKPPGATFNGVCDTTSSPQYAPATIDLAAHWMWYQPGGVPNPFQSTGSNTFKAYLIFRLRAGKID